MNVQLFRLLLCVWFCGAACGFANAQWSVSLDTQTIELNSAAESSTTKAIIFRVSSTAADVSPDSIRLKLASSNLLGRGNVKLQPEQEIYEPEFSGKSWLVPITVSGYQAGDEDTKIINVFVNDSERGVPIRIDIKKPTKEFSWTVSYPRSEIAINKNKPEIEVLISIGNIPASEVKVGRSESIESNTKRILSNGWVLCRREHNGSKVRENCSPKNIEGNTHSTFYVRPENQGDLIGKYPTKILLVAKETSIPQTLDLTVYGSSDAHKTWGVIALIAAILLSWFASTYAAFALSKLRLRRSVTIAREKLDKLEYRIGNLSLAAGNDLKVISKTIFDLKEQTTWNRIKKEEDIAFRPNEAAGVNTDKAEKRLHDVSSRIRMLDLLIRYGYEAIEREAKTRSVSKQSHKYKHVTAAFAELESLAGKKPVIGDTAVSEAELETLLSDANDFVEDFKSHFTAQPALPGQMGPTQRIYLSAVQSIENEIRALGFALLSINILVSATVGYFALIDQNPGFGLPRDYVICFLWGLGLPAVGSQFLQQTPMSIRTKLRLPS